MTSTAPSTLTGAATQGLPPSWWARGTTLRERLSAPDLPVPGATGPAQGRRTWPALEQECLTVRLAGLGVGPELTAALAAEAPERLAGRVAKPGWAVFVEQAVAAAPEDGGDDAPPPAGGAAVFVPVCRTLVEAAVDSMTELSRAGAAEPADLAVLSGQFADWLGQRLAEQAARTLAAELGAARAAGRLSGAGPEDRFADFLRRVGTRSGLGRLFADHPVLARLLGQTCLHAAQASAELLVRLAADRSAVVGALLGGTDPGPLAQVELGHGDAHQQGRSVALLRFADGSTVVYKPRALAQHALLDSTAGWLNTKVPGLGLRTPGTVPGEGYGWLEYIDHRTCRSVTEVDRFYRRQGALLALAYAVEGTDLHYENLVAHGDQPVLVDVETLLHPTLPEVTSTRPDPAAAALASSVHRTCLLPQLMVGELGAMDISAIGGGGQGGDYPNTRMSWVGAGTDTMRLVRRSVPFTGARNRPQSADGGTGLADHREALLTGFRVGYDAIVAHRDELCCPAGPLAAGADAVGRLIARPTQLYATLLEESTHPDVLRDGLDRDAVFSVLWAESAGDPARQRLIEHEIADLWRGDVPVFFHRPAEPDLLTSVGTRVSGVLDTPGYASALGKIGTMGEVDRHDQEWLISATLATARPDSAASHHRSVARAQPAPAAVPEPQVLLAAACGIADEIAARAAHGRGRANWIGLEPVDAHWTVLPMGAGLAHGYPGVALFLAQLGSLTGSQRYTDLARAALAPVSELVTALAADPDLSRAVGPGGFDGLGGICYAVSRLATLVDGGIADCLPTALDALTVAALDTADVPTDVSAGLAGALAALHTVHRERGLPSAARLADRIAELLLDRTRPGRPAGAPGFAFGDAGVGWALMRHGGLVGGPGGRRYAAVGRDLLTPALEAAQRSPDGLGWCSGLSGTVLAAADGPAGLPADALRGSVRLLAEGAPLMDLSLCHGDLGTAEALTVLAAQGHEGARTGLAHRAGLVLGSLQHQGHRSGTPGHVPSPGLLSGLSGIGYALLRLAFADAVPSVLLLDPTPSAGLGGSHPGQA